MSHDWRNQWKWKRHTANGLYHDTISREIMDMFDILWYLHFSPLGRPWAIACLYVRKTVTKDSHNKRMGTTSAKVELDYWRSWNILGHDSRHQRSEILPLPPSSWQFSFTSILQARPEAIFEAFFLSLVETFIWIVDGVLRSAPLQLGNVIRLAPAVFKFSIFRVWLGKRHFKQPLLYYGTDHDWYLSQASRIKINRSRTSTSSIIGSLSGLTQRATANHLSVKFEVLEFQRLSVRLNTFRIGTEANPSLLGFRTALHRDCFSKRKPMSTVWHAPFPW